MLKTVVAGLLGGIVGGVAGAAIVAANQPGRYQYHVVDIQAVVRMDTVKGHSKLCVIDKDTKVYKC
ncbi:MULTISPECIES: hypothetical protein [Kordiimonas]|jgi:hypothetical protein|uniref:hypothetical protein n=1 Tax=Kordiimonas TaxID=288021 RepID=UPI00257ECDE7|nr:hypothetical protein [Kordiimonas sp. UBA4487]